MLKKLLVKILVYLFNHRAEVRLVVEEVSKLDIRGERKRSLALNMLRERFPGDSTKNLALLIELVLQEA